MRNIKCYPIENHPNDSRARICEDGIVQTLSSRMGTGGNNTPFVLITSTKADTQSGNHTTSQAYALKADHAETEAKDLFVANSSGDGVAAPLDASYYKGQGLRQGIEREYVVMNAYCAGNGQLDQASISDVVSTLDCMHDQKMVIIENDMKYYTKQAHGEYIDGKVASSLKQRDYKEYTDVVQDEQKRKYVLRRLTPTECARLQGFPDWWCDGANGSDSAQYKLWGNGVALPCVAFIIGRIAGVKTDAAT
jgi:site-specific DNA-cytosine methylase